MSIPSSIIRASYHHPVLQEIHNTRRLNKENISYPIFISDVDDCKEAIKSLPLQYRFGINHLKNLLDPLVQKGLQSVLLFGVLQKGEKDIAGSLANDIEGPVIKAITLIKKSYPSLLILCDVCLCAYTSSGHCGILLNDGTVDSIQTNKRLADISVSYILSGAHGVVPSDMMDGRILEIKTALIKHNLAHRATTISMSSKYCSAFYGPFRDAVNTNYQFGNRKTYQLPISSRNLGIRAATRDYNEGCDFILVKPMMPYLDMIRDAQSTFPNMPIATYQVSGEYAMIYHAHKAGVFTLKDGVMESLNGALRAGASLIFTYFAPQVLDWIKEDFNPKL